MIVNAIIVIPAANHELLFCSRYLTKALYTPPSSQLFLEMDTAIVPIVRKSGAEKTCRLWHGSAELEFQSSASPFLWIPKICFFLVCPISMSEHRSLYCCSHWKHAMHSWFLSLVQPITHSNSCLESDNLPAPWLTTIVQDITTFCLDCCRSLLTGLPASILTFSKAFHRILGSVIFTKPYHVIKTFAPLRITSITPRGPDYCCLTVLISFQVLPHSLHSVIDTVTILLLLQKALLSHIMAFALTAPSAWNAHLWELSFHVGFCSAISLPRPISKIRL